MTNGKITLRKNLSGTLETKLGTLQDLKPLGEGGNGLVYSATLHGWDVAVKFLTDYTKSKIERFKAEYLYTLLLPPNIYVAQSLHYDEVSFDGGIYPFIVMKRYDSSFKGKRVNDLEALNKFFNRMLKTLDFIHKHGIVHRDIKPENLLLKDDKLHIADFGIASYDDSIYAGKIIDTKSGERLGNYLFSAPEQAIGGTAPHPRMDIYALGQLCQWYVTGDVHKGTERANLQKLIPGAAIIDEVVHKCLSNNPEDRFQSVDSILKFIQEREASTAEKDIWQYIYAFGNALSASLPKGLNKINHVTERTKLNRLLDNLSKEEFDGNLWWFTGIGDNSIDDLRKIDDDYLKLEGGCWLIDGMELQPQAAWVCFDLSQYNDLILFQFNPMPSFSIYKDDGYDYQEAALVDESFYVSRPEYDNGYAELDNGEVIKLSEHRIDLRRRHLKELYFFVSTRYHCALQKKNERDVAEFIDKIDKGDKVSIESLKTLLQRVRRHKDFKVLERL